jgi:nitrogen regulatory protein P-II 1
VRGHGRQKGYTEMYRGTEYKLDLLPKVKLEIFLPNSRAEEIVRVLSTTASSVKIGDGKIFASSIEEAMRIRYGDRGETAL